jgi:hypothetical protein
MAGPVCQGKIIRRVCEIVRDDAGSDGFRFSEDQVNIVCPWHGYEFDIATGVHQGSSRIALRALDVEVFNEKVTVSLPAQTRDRIASAGGERRQAAYDRRKFQMANADRIMM